MSIIPCNIIRRASWLRLAAVLAIMLMTAGTMMAQTNITSLNAITDANGHYVITSNISGGTTGVTSFAGTLEADIDPTTKMPYKITGLAAPLFTTLTGTVKNLVLENVNITSGTDVGAIACTASGGARVYNVGILSGSVSGTNYVGGLVGLLDGTGTDDKPRVINCYSYANINGGAVGAGIVGYNNFASNYQNVKTMIMNCMFYGEIDTTAVTSFYPVYGGVEISNDYYADNSYRLNNYNYFLYEAPYSIDRRISENKYNCALAAEARFLVRFEFYRHLLNSNRELAAWYATGNTADGRGVGSANKMLKWVLDRSIAPYPILKIQGTYPSIVNYDQDYTNDPTDGHRVQRTSVTAVNQGKNLGSLTININESNTTTGGQNKPSGASVTTASITRQRTDKDLANYNFNYDKVQLPYYNEVGTGNYTGNKVVTGWKITAINSVANDPYTSSNYTGTNYDSPNYNFADRSSGNKDLYSVSGRIYAQGSYFNVPTGVTSIDIEPYWGKAVYLSDACYDHYGYSNTSDDLTQIAGTRYSNNTAYSINNSSQKVYTTFSNALSNLPDAASVYDNAVVLVGNYHHRSNLGKNGDEMSNGTKPFTVTSIDLNGDNEPDYCFIYRSGKNRKIAPIRYDFITVPAYSMAQKCATSGDLAIPGNCCPAGWFEITTTGLIKFGQFEHSTNYKALSPLIFMGGVIDQFVANNTGTNNSFTDKTKYMHFGDNVWFKMFSNGTHMDKTTTSPHRPISVTGGEYEVFYLSGYFRPDAAACTSGNGERNAECYIDGGRFGEVAGAGQEKIDGYVEWFINNADIETFFGGGINNAKPISGNITTVIKNSRVNEFYGGPKFGDMYRDETNPANNKTVTTTATNCTFGTFFGAGYGGTAYYKEQFYNLYESLNYNDWNNQVNNNYKSGSRGKYTQGKGVAVDYEYEFFGGSGGNVHRLYMRYASFSLAQTNNVNSTLTGCTVLGNFYGGGSLGAVAGNATSVLDDCTVKGNVFGAGYSVTIPTLNVRNLRTNPGPFIPEPKYNTKTALYEAGGYPGTVTYKWVNASISNGGNALVDDGDNHTIKTNVNLNNLGAVHGSVFLTIKGNSIIGTEGDANTGNVYGGGDMSTVPGTVLEGNQLKPGTGNTIVNLEDNTMVRGNVFGGGNKGSVSGSSKVNIQDSPAP